MPNRNILVIGGNGFIGRNLCQTLLEHGEKVYSFDIQKPVEVNEKINYIVGDFFDDENLQSAIEGKDIIIHSLSTVNPGNSNERFMQGYSRDFLQSVKLFSWIIKNKQKLIFLSSGGTVYGIQDKQPISEDQMALPINHYGTVKLCIENVIRTFNTQSHTNMLIARISNPYGPGQDYTKGVGLVDAALKKAISYEPIEIWGDGTVVRDYIYIDDVCEMLYSLTNYDGKEEVFNLSSNEGISQNDIVAHLKLLGLNPVVNYKPARSVDVKKIVLDNSKIMQVYEKKITSFQSGIEIYYSYLKRKEN